MLRHLAGTLLFVLYLPVAQATLREIEPGEHAELAADEGLLLVSVDTDFALGGVRIQRAGSLAATFLRDIKPGVQARLYAATAGDYYFDHASVTTSGRWHLAGRPPQLVEVKGAGHGMTTAEQRAVVYPALVKFLQDHLGTP